MVKIVLIQDPETGRALYSDETKVMGVFESVMAAKKELGALMSYCNIETV
jgi:hypothetical protein